MGLEQTVQRLTRFCSKNYFKVLNRAVHNKTKNQPLLSRLEQYLPQTVFHTYSLALLPFPKIFLGVTAGITAFSLYRGIKNNVPDFKRYLDVHEENLEFVHQFGELHSYNLPRILLDELATKVLSNEEKKDLLTIGNSQRVFEKYIANAETITTISNRDVRNKFIAHLNSWIADSLDSELVTILDELPQGRLKTNFLRLFDESYFMLDSYKKLVQREHSETAKETLCSAIEEGYTNIYHLETALSVTEDYNNTPITQAIIKAIPRRILDTNIILKLSAYKPFIVRDDHNSPLVTAIANLIFDSERSHIDDGFDALMSLESKNLEIIKKINSLGRRRRRKLVRSIAHTYSLFRGETNKAIEEFLKQNDNNLDSLISLKEYADKSFYTKLGVENINRELTTQKRKTLIRGLYYKHQELLSYALQHNDLWNFREGRERRAIIPEHHRSIWKEPWNTQRDTDKPIVIDSRKVAEENYREAYEHMQEAGIDMTRINQNIYEGLDSMIACLKSADHTNPLIQDAQEHVEVIQSIQNSKTINAASITYKIGDLYDFLFIGEYPAKTCLGLDRSNSQFTISMIESEQFLPFIAESNVSGSRNILGRCLLRYTPEGIVADNFYGKTDGMVEVLKEFTKRFNLPLLINEKMIYRLDGFSKEANTVTINFNETIHTSFYSDSIGGRIQSEQEKINHVVYALK